MKKYLFLLVVLAGAMSAYGSVNAQEGNMGGVNSITGTNAPTPGTTAAIQVQQGNTSGFSALAPIPGLTDKASTAVVNSKTLADFLNNLYKYLIGLAAAIAVVEIIWGGLELATKDSIQKQKDGKERIREALLGLLLVLSPVLVFSIINPSILNLSLNLPELKTRPANPRPPEEPTRPCSKYIKTNCVQQIPKQESVSETAIVGQYCFMRVDPTKATSSGEYVCATTQPLCENLFNEQIKNDKLQFGEEFKFVGAPCKLRSS